MSVKNSFHFTDFENNLKHIPDLDQALQKTIKGIIKNKGYISYTVEKRNFDSGGGNFLGELIEINIKGKTVDGEKETNIFSKKKVVIEKIKLADVDDIYLKELFFYTDLSKVVTLFQNEANVPKLDRFKIAKAYDESNGNILIFENLAKKGFKTYGRLEIPSLKYMELVIEELARFHGVSFVIEHNMPEFYQKKIKSIYNPYNFDHDWKGLMQNVFLNVAELFHGEEKKRIEDFLPIAVKKLPQYEKDQSSVRCCLTHGDFRISNVLVREVNGEPEEVVIVDFQLINYGCPLKDFFFFIYSCTDKDFRTKHMDNLKELYFEALTKFLQYFNMDIDKVYPKWEFEQVYKEWKDYGLMKILSTSIFLFAPETGLDVVTKSLSELPFNPSKEFEERARGWIKEFIDWGYL